MSIMGRNVSTGTVVLTALLLLALVGGLVAAVSPAPAREIVLVARDMAFYLDDEPYTPNPRLRVRPGERVRLVLRNDDRGYTHDVAVPAAGAATPLLDWRGTGRITFMAPAVPGTYDYVCQPHALMMRGVLEVVADDRR
jgi:plastocyanin